MSSAQQSIATIDQFINTVGAGQVKAADGSKPLSEPGSIGGETSHPVKTVDDRLETAPEGERFKENTRDVKGDQGEPSVENAPEASASGSGGSAVERKGTNEGASDKKAASVFDLVSQHAHGRQKKAEGGAVSRAGSAEDDQLQIGTKKAPTGEDPSVETESAKAGKNDPGSSHPARTDNNKIDGHKWASDSPLEKLASAMKEVGDNLCAQIAWVSQNQGATGVAQKAAAHTTQQPVKQAAQEIDPYLAQQLGWEMAGLVNGTFDKQAADSLVVGTIEQIVKTAADDADRYITFMDNFLKQADGADGDPTSNGAGDDSSAGDGGGAPPGGGAPGGAPQGGGDPSGMMAALGGGADAGGGGGQDAEAMQLAQILESLGITPEELEQAMQQEQAGGGAPPGGAGGGGPPMGGMTTTAADKQAASDKFAQARQYITEIVHRSRARR